jgi:chaperonin GroEL
MLEDIAILTKGDLISEDLGIKLDNVTLEMLGTAKRVEVKERKDRVDDAMHATRAAVEEGIVPGGGTVYIKAIKALSKVTFSNLIPKSSLIT